jgi:nucleoid-associated protein YgaU
MQRDVKVGLVLGVLLVGVIAVVFFRKDDAEQEKFSQLLPSPDVVVNRARDALGPSAAEPYPVAPEHLVDRWQGSAAPAPARTPSPARSRLPDSASGDAAHDTKNASESAAAVLLPPEIESPRPAPRAKLDSTSSARRTARTEATARTARTTDDGEYTIKDGDTLSSIASERLGSASLYPLIFEENRHVLHDENVLPVGQKIRIPRLRSESATPLAVASPSGNGRRTVEPVRTAPTPGYDLYEVKEGDTLISIARERYRKSSMYKEIFDANKDELQLSSPDDIRQGMILKLPKQ